MKRLLIVLSLALLLLAQPLHAANDGSGRLSAGGQLVPDRVDIPLTHYRQTDPAWAAVELRPGATMGEIGCAVTSLAMLAEVYQIQLNPAELARELGRWAAPLEWEAFAAQRQLRLAREDNLLDIDPRVADRDYVRDTTVRILSEGQPVILGIQHEGHLTTHFVVAHGYVYENGDYRVRILDPSLNNDYQWLDEIDEAWAFIRLLVVTAPGA